MSGRHWAWIAAGLLAWAALALLWVTTPTNCHVPKGDGHIACGEAGATR